MTFLANKTEILAADILDELLTFEIPLTATTAVVSLAVIYCLIVNNRLMQKVSDKQDPFSNTNLLALLLVFIDMQRIIFKLVEYFMIKNYSQTLPDDKDYTAYIWEVSRMRYAIMSVEMLFIVMPMRHNFALHRLEM
jgi:hypothetical protein